jgi:hypothetical protein
VAMQPTTWSLNALATELHMDRRTLAKRLGRVPPAEGTGRRKRWHLADVLDALRRHERGLRSPSGDRRADVREVLESVAIPTACLTPWLPESAEGLRRRGLVVTFDEAARLAGVGEDELLTWIGYGLPILPAAEGETLGRISIPHLNAWRAMIGALVHVCGGDALVHNPVEEVQRLRGLA